MERCKTILNITKRIFEFLNFRKKHPGKKKQKNPVLFPLTFFLKIEKKKKNFLKNQLN